jgi:hypothetical protein
VAQIDEGYPESKLAQGEIVALELTDALVGRDVDVPERLRARLLSQFRSDEIVEMALGVAILHALSKALIALGLEPEVMPVTVLPTPGTSQRNL